jgi:WD40 repeat protein
MEDYFEELVIDTNSIVNSVAYSPDGQCIASGSQNDYVKVWDAMSGDITAILEGHSDRVESVAYSPDGQCIASVSYDNTVRVCDAMSGAIVATLDGYSYSVMSVAYSPDGQCIASGSCENIVQVLDAMSGAIKATLKGHSGCVWSVAYSPDGKYIASGSEDQSVRVWDVESGAITATLKGHSSDVYSVAYSPNGKYIASGSGDSSVKVWDTMSGAITATLKGHSYSVFSVAFSPDGRNIASGSRDESVKVWDAMSGAIVATLKGHSNTVRSVAFSPDGQCIASGSGDEKIIIWKKEAIVNIESYPEINEKLLKSKSLSMENKKKYITDIMSDYTKFSKYFIKNYLIKNGTEIKNMNYNEFFTLISSFLPLNNLSAFADIIIQFINSIPEELNKPFYSRHINDSNDTRKFILNIYKNIIQEYIKYLKNTFILTQPRFINRKYKTKKNNELKLLLENFGLEFISNNYNRTKYTLTPLTSVKIEYIGEPGVNAGGLSREFFKNLEKQLNYKQDLLNVKKNLNNLGTKNERNLMEIENIIIKTKNIEDLSDEEIINILVFSKVNNNPIYINNDRLKEVILKKIRSSIKKHLNKNFIYNFLKYEGNLNTKDATYEKPETIFLNGTNNLGNTNCSLTAIKKYIKNKFNSNEKEFINNKYLLNKTNVVNAENGVLINYISALFIDENKIYKNFLDFYVSHFINFSLNVDDIINNLTFINATPEFIVKFKGLLKNLSDEELKKFNECISGSFKLQPRYIIQIINYGTISKLSIYHTCFSRMDIRGIDNFINNFLQFENNSNNYKKLVIREQCKKDFMETIYTALEQGFAIA